MARKHTYLYSFVLVIGVLCIMAIWMGDPENVANLTKEDGVVETLSALFYLLGFFGCLVVIYKKRFVRLFYLWLFLCFLFLGEETSWFQRYLNYSVPQIENANAQSEFNVHNLNIWGDGRFVDHERKLRKLNLQILLTPQSLFRMGIFVYFVLLPIGFLNGKIKSLLLKIGYAKPSTLFVFVMWSVIMLSVVFAFFASTPIKNALAETREMFYAFFIFLYILSFAFFAEERG